MVIASISNGVGTSDGTSRLRRSRRLSSTRGLKPKCTNVNSHEQTPCQDLNQKLGLCPIVSRNVDERETKRFLINWELNERISLSSGSSTGLEIRPDMRRGIEFEEDRKKDELRQGRTEKRDNGPLVRSQDESREDLDLMNVSGFPGEVIKKHRGTWTIAIDVVKGQEENIIRSDSKYEIGMPSRASARSKSKHTGDSETRGEPKSSNRSTKGSRDRFSAHKEKVRNPNDSISKRLALIHELNQKIMANYEKFQHKTERFGKESKESNKDTIAKSTARKKKIFNNDGQRKNEILYTEVKRKNKSERDSSENKSAGHSFGQENLDTNKFTFSKEHCERLMSKGKYDRDPKEKSSGRSNADERETNGNFSLAVKPNFCHRVESKVRNQISRIECSMAKVDCKSLKEVSSELVTEKASSARPSVVESTDTNNQCLENSRFYPDSPFKVFAKTPCDVGKRKYDDSQKKDAIGDTKDEEISSMKEAKEMADQKALEKEILENLNNTIDKFDSERTDNILANNTESSNCSDKCESFSTDSIQTSSPLSVSRSPKNGSLIETFNSSWDSGVGADVNAGSGWVRIHTGIESSLVYLTLETTTRDVCRDMLLGDELSLFIQYGGESGRRLSPQEKPLEIQDRFLQKLGYQDVSRRSRLGVDPELRHLIAFHVGPASPLNDLAGYSRCGYALVLKGLVFPQWKKRPLAVVGSRLFLYPACPDSLPEWMELSAGGSVCYAPSRLGKLVLRVTGYPRVGQPNNRPSCHTETVATHHDETRHLYLGFHHPWDRDLWRTWIKQATQLPSCPKRLDLSKGGLSRLPDSILAFPTIEEISLGQNQLNNSENNLTLLSRFPRLQIIYLNGNNFKLIPRILFELHNVTYFNLSDNKIEEIPSEIRCLVNLKELILDRNEIKDLPNEVGELKHLTNISIVGNLLNSFPRFLNMRALTLTEVLSKGDHGKSYKDEKNNQNNLNKINLRNNQLKGNIILGNYGYLTHLDVSENSIEKLDISALQELRSVRCARNNLTELTVCGKNLVSLIAGNNRLKRLIIEPVPNNLEHLDISYNNLDSLPEWTPDLPVLRALFASHNALTALPDRLLSQPSRLEVLHLPHNRLQALPPPRRPLNIVHLTLQGNALTALPTSFFANTEKMKVLNLSNNRLSELPYLSEGNKNRHSNHTLEKLYLTANCLTDTALDALAKLGALRVLHIAYNVIDTLPESCIASWSDLEELVLSGNRLQYLPDNVASLQHLRVLRVHTNRLLTCPTFNKTTSLKVLDLAHNQLDRINLATLVPPQLQFLDISCNSRLHVDPRQFQVYRSQRPISLVDVSGQNRPSLPSHPHQQEIVSSEKNNEQPWRLGFSETAGSREKLYISQIRMPAFCNIEGLFGIFDGGSNLEAPSALQEMIPRLLLEERTVRETSKEYLKYTLLSAHRELKEKGQKYGIDATLVHIVRAPQNQNYSRTSSKYILRVTSSGEAKAVLCRAAGPLTLAPTKKLPVKNQLGNAAMFPLIVPDPISEEVALEDDDEFVIIANRRIWEVLSVQEAVREARAEASSVLAAKRLQDLAQAYGAEDNLSVIVVRLTGPNPGDLDQLMRELRHVVGKNRNQGEGVCSCPCCVPPTTHKPPGPCCCHANEGYYLNGVLKNIVNRSNKSHNGSGRYFKNSRNGLENESPPYRDDRSSPSGQSDQASDSTFKSRNPSGRLWSGSAASRATNKARQSVLMQENGTRKVTCLPAQEDAASERSGALSEEQFRCWEYMLEQNTQLLFDKELDTLTRAPLRRGQSRSTPQLAGNLPFLSKRFGSARSFNPAIPRPPVVRFGSGRRLLNGGPNAAYFGSLQRLMPYNLEYDFAVIQERGGLDSLEQDTSRMQQYWGVATTEL